MGTVICVYKLVPDAPDSVASVKNAVEALNPSKLVEEPLAFGLNVIKATFMVPEEEGKLEELENALSTIEHVEDVELENMTRSL